MLNSQVVVALILYSNIIWSVLSDTPFPSFTTNDTITLTQVESPYVASDDVIIPEDGHLIVHAGVVVKFAPGKGMDVHGTIHIDGKPSAVVLFKVWSDFPVSRHERKPSEYVRLTTSIRDDLGTLTVKHSDGQWGAICDSRLGDIENEKVWANNVVKAVCSELGFVPSSTAKLIKGENPGMILEDHRWTCYGDDVINPIKVENCQVECCYGCDARIHVLGVDCSSVKFGQHWRGLHFSNTSQPSQSNLRYLTIWQAGVGIEEDGEASLVPALFTISGTPYTKNVTVLESADHGIFYSELEGKSTITDLLVKKNRGHGLYINSFVDEMQISNVNAEGNKEHGILVQRLLNSDSLGGNDFCALRCIRCTHTVEEFPLTYTWDKLNTVRNKSCQATFTTEEEGHVLAFKVISSTNNVHVSLRDGAFIDSPFVWSADVKISQWANPPPVIVTRTKSITIKIVSTFYRDHESVSFILLSGKPGSFGITVQNVQTTSNGGNGIMLQNIQMPVEITDLITKDNMDGLQLKSCSLYSNLSNIQAHYNKRSGIAVDDTDGQVHVHKSIFTLNRVNGMAFFYDRVCTRESVTERYAMNIHLENNLFANNTQTGFYLKSTCRYNVTLIGNKIRNSGIRSIHLSLADNHMHHLHNLYMLSNTVENSMYGVSIEGVSPIMIDIRHNKFKYNKNTVLFIHINNNYFDKRTTSVFIFENEFLDNQIRAGSVLLFFVESSSGSSKNVNYTITRNTFRSNIISKQQDSYIYSLEDLSAVVHLTANANVNLKQNIFDNPQSQFEVSSGDTNPTNIIDARYCFWKTNEISWISARIFANHQSYILSQVLFHPYLNSEEMYDYDATLPERTDFQMGNIIGGLLTENYTLSNRDITYMVNRDIIISRNATLTIDQGVHLQFKLGVAILVHGQINLLGEPENRILLEGDQKLTPNNIRLKDGNNPWEGVVQVRMSNSWFSLCAHSSYDSDAKTRNFLCHSLNFQDSNSFVFVNNMYVEGITGPVQCHDNHFSLCTFTDHRECSTKKVLFLHCEYNHWSGIHLTVHAKPSVIKYVDFKHTGYGNTKSSRAAIEVDFNQHLLESVSIDQTSDHDEVLAVLIRKQSVINNNILNELHVKNFRGSGLVTYDSRLTLENSSFVNVGENNNHQGIFIGSSMTHIDTFDYNYIIPMCSVKQYVLNDHEQILIRVFDVILQTQWSKCELALISSNGYRIAVQVIAGEVNQDRSCGEQTLMFYNGRINQSQPFGLQASSDGYAWLSSKNRATILMHRVYDAVDQCMDIILSVTSFGHIVKLPTGPVLRNIQVMKYKEGLRLHELQTKVNIFNFSTSEAFNNGIYIVGGESEIRISNSVINSSGDSGVYSKFLHGNISILSTIFHNTITRGALFLLTANYPEERLMVFVNKCNFMNNTKAIEISKLNNRLRRYPNSWQVTIVGNQFYNNYDAVNVWLLSENHLGYHHLIFQNNILEHNIRGILYKENNYKDLHTWNIVNNTFNKFKRIVLDLKGSGLVSNNVISNNQNPSSNIVNIETGEYIFVFSNNKLLNNSNSRYVTNLLVSSHNASIIGNKFVKNEIDDAVIYLDTRFVNMFDIIPIFTENVFLENIPLDNCRETTAFLIKGYRRYVYNFNSFDNPSLTKEVTIDQISHNSSAILDMSRNYWGHADVDQIIQRLKDGRTVYSKLKIAFSPYFTNPTFTSVFSAFSERSIVQEDNILNGLIVKDTTLSTTNPVYDILGDLEVPSGVTLTLPPGTSLLLQPDSRVYVHGTINVKGTIDHPVIIQRGHFHQMMDCFSRVRLIGRPNPNEGRLEIMEDGSWMPVCHKGWTYENAQVICRLLGYGPASSHYYNAGEGNLEQTTPSRQIFQCSGTEASLRLCRHYYTSKPCTSHNPVGMVCSLRLPKPIIVLAASVDEIQSLITNVHFGNISELQVSGAPPLIENITLQDTDSGLTYLGSGIANEKDVMINNIQVMRSAGNGISLFDITSNVTIANARISDVGHNGIFISPTYDGKKMHFPKDIQSTFHFCDSETVLNIVKNEEFKHFSNGGLSYTGCRRVFRTIPGYSVRLVLKAVTDSYDWLPIAAVYDGEAVNKNRKLYQFNTIREDRGPQVVELESISNSMTVWVFAEERDIAFAAVSSVPAKENDCSFEDGTCGWRNADDIYAVERGMWFMYSCNTKAHKAMKGLETDVNFPTGDDGHYMVVGETSTACNYNDARYKRSETAILESPLYESDKKICSVSFHHFRTIAHYYRAEHLTLYLKTQDNLIQLWRDTSFGNYSTWRQTTVSLLSKELADTFSLVFFAEFMKDCPNSVGIDDIKFHRCPEEKLVSTVRIVNSALKNIPHIPLYIRNTDHEKHNIIWIEKVSIHDSAWQTKPDSSSIYIDMKSAYVLVRNTFITKITNRAIHVQFDSNTKHRISEVTISQNSIEYCTGGGAIYVSNQGVNNAATWIRGNNIIHNTAYDRKSIVQIVNSSLVLDSNLIYNNSGKYILELGSSHLTNKLYQQIVENTFWLNSPQKAASEYTISVNATNVDFNDNVVNNPSSSFEISARSGIGNSAKINCTSNWWGSGKLEAAKSKIRDGRNTMTLPYIPYRPILEKPPPYFGLSSSCLLGWKRHDSYCFLFNGGAVEFAYAAAACERNGALVMMKGSVNTEYLKDMTKYRDVTGDTKYSTVWVDGVENQLSLYTGHCHTLQYDGEMLKESVTIKPGGCYNMNPFICQKVNTVLCKNACSQHGACIGKTCLCHKGWEKEDCSAFHCADISYCGGHGKCMGPNICACDPGWMGRACSVSYCSRFQRCNVCTRKTGCGWCDTTQKCLPGSGYSASVGKCESWFYYKCMTLEDSTRCTSDINHLECDSRYCNTNNTETDRGLCQRCNDIKECYSIQGTDHCYTWNESKCPKGSPVPNYNDTNRIHNTVFKDNVKVIPPEKTLYLCPYRVTSDPSDETYLFISTAKKLSIKVNDIVTSAQSDGIMHKVEYVGSSEGFQFFLGVPVGLRDLLKYADFSQMVDMQELMHPLSQEQPPDPDLLDQILYKEMSIKDTVHMLDQTSEVFKCTGHMYEEQGNFLGTSYYIVIPSVNLPREKLTKGDIVMSNSTLYFLETVLELNKTEMGYFISSKLTSCGGSAKLEKIEIDTSYGQPKMHCYGGNGFPGLLHFDSVPHNDPNIVGKSIIGRRATSVLAKILDIFSVTTNGYTYIEVIDVDFEDNGRLISSVDPILLNTERRRTKRSAPANFIKSATKRFTYDLSDGGKLMLRPSGSIDVTFDPVVEVDWNWDKMELEWKIGAQFSGTFNAGVGMELVFNGDVAEHGGPLRLFQKKLPAFSIPIGEPTTPVIGTAEFHVELSWNLSAMGKGTFYSNGYAEGKVEAGFATVGLPNARHHADGFADGNMTATIDKGNIAAVLQVKPSLLVKWPAIEMKMLSYNNTVPNSITKFIAIQSPKHGSMKETISEKVLPYMDVLFSAPLEVTSFAQTCSQACLDPYKSMNIGMESRVKQLEVKMTGLNMFVEEFKKHDPFTFRANYCIEQASACCTCTDTSQPGILDQRSGQCLCPCCCDSHDGTNDINLNVEDDCVMKSTKTIGEECSCEKCPDDKTLRKWLADIQCPCTCGDGKQREMNNNGTCDCGCTCADGSRDIIDTDGECPCECHCKNCERSVLGPSGCKCTADVCPICEDGVEPMWINCECRCPEPDCGIPPTCVHGRGGKNCDQPDCLPCQSCSGNGVCRSIPGSCDSFCECGAQWQGKCCETRRPRRAYGDPHIETLDGIWFDYFGIGQFWDCKSEANDFGFQVRFFYYKQTSFTGGVAVKAGESIVTVTTPTPDSEQEKPMVRLNGELMNTDYALKLTLHNSTKVNIQPNYQSESEDMAMLLVSFGYKSGASLTVDVRYSPKLQRQYLNIMYTLTKDFMNQTSGLCGLMDDNRANDLMGPKGTMYNSIDAFVESWRIHKFSRHNGGTKNSWSWTETNFHKDDILDISYTDSSYQPVYSISGFTQSQIKTAVGVCDSLGLTQDLLDGCIYDLVITNDTSLAEQETLKVGCPKQCSGKGRCSKDAKCMCLDGWSGKDCSVGACGTCYFGECKAGFCECDIGWDGPLCMEKATCDEVNFCTNEEHGICEKINKCLCSDGYTGQDCSLIATCYNVNNCSDNNGVCIDFDMCRCNLGWKGEMCDAYSCESLQDCSQHGKCVGYDLCICDTGWKGPSCNIPNCKDIRDCFGNGKCILPNNCSCFNGYEAPDCSEKVSCPLLDDCSNHGLCTKANDTNEEIQCRCFENFSGLTCNITICPLVNNCSDHGYCVEPNVCECYVGYGGSNCSQLTCDKLNRCSGHGKCVGYNKCQCDIDWLGDDCSEADCRYKYNCSSQGICILPNTCDCFDGYQGVYCTEIADKNRNSPMFDKDIYEVTLQENPITPMYLITVLATDQDNYKNGEVRYSIDPAGLPLNINLYLTIDSKGGEIVLLKPLNSKHTKNGVFQLSIVASDRGAPSLKTASLLNINIIDENDHCPSVLYPAVNEIVYFNSSSSLNTTVILIHAIDLDREENGQLGFTLSNTLDIPFFAIDEEWGRLYLVENSETIIGKHAVSVTVTDKGTNPCAITCTFQLIVVSGEYIPTALDATDIVNNEKSLLGLTPTLIGVISSGEVEQTTKVISYNKDESNIDRGIKLGGSGNIISSPSPTLATETVIAYKTNNAATITLSLLFVIVLLVLMFISFLFIRERKKNKKLEVEIDDIDEK